VLYGRNPGTPAALAAINARAGVTGSPPTSRTMIIFRICHATLEQQ
jgi:hypothetical protein